MVNVEVFKDGWTGQSEETSCGRGSSKKFTEAVRANLRGLLEKYGVEKVNDAGCGDVAWLQKIDLGAIKYAGFDAHERSTWDELRGQGYDLNTLNIVEGIMPNADLILCRDVFIHLPNDMIFEALRNFRKSARYLLTTTYEDSDEITIYGSHRVNNDDRMSEPSLRHAKLDLSLPPFSLGKPLEKFEDDFPHKYMALYDLSATPELA